MTTRERNLASTLLVLLLGGGGVLLAKAVYFDQAGVLDRELKAKKTQIDTLVADIKKEREYVAGISRLSPRLGQWEKVSLPDSDAKTEAARVTHLRRMSEEYAKF